MSNETAKTVLPIVSHLVATVGATVIVWTACRKRRMNAAPAPGPGAAPAPGPGAAPAPEPDAELQPMGDGGAPPQPLPAAEPAPARKSCLPVLIYAAYAFPNITGAWTNWGKASQTDNDFVTAAAIGKVVADWRVTSPGWQATSPIVESVVNFIWLGPAFSAFFDSNRKVSDWTGLSANLAFDASGMLAPWQTEYPLVIDVLNGAYGVLSLATAVALCEED